MLLFVPVLVLAALPCPGQTKDRPLCPKHIEDPTYPAIARTAHVTGKVVLALTIDADGKVTNAEVSNENEQGVKLLAIGTVRNARLWTFEKPPTAPYKQTITYIFEIDGSLTPSGGRNSAPAIVKVTYDLPDVVTVATNASFLNTASATSK